MSLELIKLGYEAALERLSYLMSFENLSVNELREFDALVKFIERFDSEILGFE